MTLHLVHLEANRKKINCFSCFLPLSDSVQCHCQLDAQVDIISSLVYNKTTHKASSLQMVESLNCIKHLVCHKLHNCLLVIKDYTSLKSGQACNVATLGV